jgi:hypothetical protein
VFETPVKARGISPHDDTDFALPALFATPTKPVSAPESGVAPAALAASNNNDAEASIYDALGWNDDDNGF